MILRKVYQSFHKILEDISGVTHQCIRGGIIGQYRCTVSFTSGGDLSNMYIQ